MRVLSILIPSAPRFELIFVFVLRLTLWSVIIVRLFCVNKTKSVEVEFWECIFLCSPFKEERRNFNVYVSVAFTSSTSEYTSQPLIDAFPSIRQRFLREKQRATWTAADRRDELTLRPPDGIHYEEIENSPARFFSVFFFPPVRTTVERPLAGCTQLWWILKQRDSSSGEF